MYDSPKCGIFGNAEQRFVVMEETILYCLTKISDVKATRKNTNETCLSREAIEICTIFSID